MSSTFTEPASNESSLQVSSLRAQFAFTIKRSYPSLLLLSVSIASLKPCLRTTSRAITFSSLVSPAFFLSSTILDMTISSILDFAEMSSIPYLPFSHRSTRALQKVAESV